MLFMIDWLQKKAEGAKKELLSEPKKEKPAKKVGHPKRQVRYWNC